MTLKNHDIQNNCELGVFDLSSSDLKHRKKYSEKVLQQDFAFTQLKSDNILRSGLNYVKKNYRPSSLCFKIYFFKRFPFFEWIIGYNVKECLIKDIIAGECYLLTLSFIA
jgi:hypothetical protein